MKTQNKHFVLISLLLISFATMAQDWVWTADLNCTNNSQPNVTALDNSGNILSLMVFEGDATIGGRTISAVGGKDILLSKLSSSGDTLWNIPIGSSGDDVPRRISITDADEILITGGFSDTCDFGGQILTNTYSSEDVFLAKYASNGSLLWAKNIAWGPDQDRSSGIVMDDGGNIGLVGFFKDSIFFERDTIKSNGLINNFFAKYDANGNFIRAIHYPGTHNTTRLNEISLSNDNAYLISGFYSGTLTAQTESLVSTGGADIVLIKTDTAGAELWIRTAGGSSDDRGANASTDRYGNIYLSGYFTGTVEFDSTANGLRESSSIVSAGSNDMFAAKYNKNGTLQWKNRSGDSYSDRGQGIQVYNDIVQFTGFISRTVIFGSDTLVSKNNSNDAGIFIYNTKGDALKAVSVPGSAEDRGLDVMYDGAGFSYLAGYFYSDTLEFGDQNIVKSASGAKNPFIAKYSIPFSASFTEISGIDCNGDTDGELVATPYFGVKPYTYEWSHDAGLNDSTAANLTAGNYSVSITDARDSVAFISITLTEPSAIAISKNLGNVSCHPSNGVSNNGSIDLTVSGGSVSSTYLYIWEAISGSGVNATSEDQSTLTTGEYSVTVTDDNGCESIDTSMISQPNPIIFQGSVVTSATGGSNDGAIDLNPAGGNVTPYTFAWSNLEVTEDISSLYAGNYAVTVTDGLTCFEDTTFLVFDASAFLAFISDKTDVDCKGNLTGSATVNTTGGVGDYDYAWENSVGGSVGGSFAMLSNVAAGSYFVTVTDNDDMSTAEASVQINEPSQALSTFISGTDPLCYNGNRGSADLTVSGGTLPLGFLWSNGTKTEDLVNIPAASYSVAVTDENGCEISDDITITEPTAMDINITIDQAILCNGDLSGVLTATATGGTGTKSYLWDDPGNQTVKTATNLGGGYYNVTATDINLCAVTEMILLTQPAQLSLTQTRQDVSCFGANDGLINLSVTGGTPLFNYDWSDGSITQDISDLMPGPYSVLVTDANNCVANLATAISEPEVLIIDAISSSDANCFSNPDGEIVITAMGGIREYEYSIDNGSTYLADSTFSNLAADTYTVVVRDANNCVSSSSDELIDGPDELSIVSQSVDGTTISIEAEGGTAPYSYTLDGGEQNSTGVFENVSAGTHSVEITDANSCGPLVIDDLNVITSIETYDQNTLSIYPNPSKGIFNFNLETNSIQEYRVQIYSLTGELIMDELVPVNQGSDNPYTIDLSNVQPGVYFMKLNGIAVNQRLIVQ